METVFGEESKDDPDRGELHYSQYVSLYTNQYFRLYFSAEYVYQEQTTRNM